MVMLFVLPMWINFVLRTGATRDILSWIGIDSGEHPIITTMIGMVYNYLPFTILPLYSTLLRLDKGQIEAAADLGCSPFQVFIKISFLNPCLELWLELKWSSCRLCRLMSYQTQ